MSKNGEKSPSRTAPARVRHAGGVRPPRSGRPREVFGRFFETLGRLDAAPPAGGEGAR
jgi:hypothetical protein